MTLYIVVKLTCWLGWCLSGENGKKATQCQLELNLKWRLSLAFHLLTHILTLGQTSPPGYMTCKGSSQHQGCNIRHFSFLGNSVSRVLEQLIPHH